MKADFYQYRYMVAGLDTREYTWSEVTEFEEMLKNKYHCKIVESFVRWCNRIAKDKKQ